MTKEQALKAMEQMYEEIDKENWLYIGTINPQMIEWAIKALKAQKTGTWERINENVFACSECGFVIFGREEISDFCPSCGADMRGEAERSE